MSVYCIVNKNIVMDEPTGKTTLRTPLAYDNNMAHAMRVTVFNEDGTEADLTGVGCIGSFMKSNGDTVTPIIGTLVANTATVILPASCYVELGRFKFTLNLTLPLSTDGYETFDTTVAYNPGDCVVYNGAVYKFILAHDAGSWNWGQVVIASITRTALWVEGIVERNVGGTIIDPGTPVQNITQAIGDANAAANAANDAAGSANAAAAAVELAIDPFGRVLRETGTWDFIRQGLKTETGSSDSVQNVEYSWDSTRDVFYVSSHGNAVSANSYFYIFRSIESLPNGLIPGETYQLKYKTVGGTRTTLSVLWFDGSRTFLKEERFTTDADITIPETVTVSGTSKTVAGMAVRLLVLAGEAVNEQIVSFGLLTGKTNTEISAEVERSESAIISLGGIPNDWEQGRLSVTNGTPLSSDYNIRSSDFINVDSYHRTICVQFLSSSQLPTGATDATFTVYEYSSTNPLQFVQRQYVNMTSLSVRQFVLDPSTTAIKFQLKYLPETTVPISTTHHHIVFPYYKDGIASIVSNETIKSASISRYENVQSMKNAPGLFAGMLCMTMGYYSTGDGGAATYRIRARETGEVEDVGLRHFVTLGDGTPGVAEMVVDSRINVLSIGCKANDDTFNNGTILNAFLANNTGPLYPVYFPKGVYTVSSTINVNYKVDFVGDYRNYTAAWMPDRSGLAESEIRTTTSTFIFFLHNRDATFSNLVFSSTLYLTTNRPTATNTKNHTVFVWNDAGAEEPLNNRAIYASWPEADEMGIKFRFACNNCAFIGFSVAVTTHALAVFNACTFAHCKTGVRITSNSVYFYNCSFTRHNYAIETNGHAINVYGCWFDMIAEHAIIGDEDHVTGVYGYINGTFDCINKSAICGWYSVYGLKVDAKIMKTGLYWVDNDEGLNEALSNATTDREKWLVLSGASAISLYTAGAININVVTAKSPWFTTDPDAYLVPKYFFNGKTIVNGSISGVFAKTGASATDTSEDYTEITMLTPLVDTANSYCLVNDGRTLYQIHDTVG